MAGHDPTGVVSVSASKSDQFTELSINDGQLPSFTGFFLSILGRFCHRTRLAFIGFFINEIFWNCWCSRFRPTRTRAALLCFHWIFFSTKCFGIVGAVVFGQPAPEPRRYGTPGARPQHNLPARAQLVRQQVRPPSSKIGFRWVRLG